MYRVVSKEYQGAKNKTATYILLLDANEHTFLTLAYTYTFWQTEASTDHSNIGLEHQRHLIWGRMCHSNPSEDRWRG